MRRKILIMAKTPEAGKVKTRLQPLFTPQQSAEFAGKLLKDTICKAETLTNELIIAYSPIDGRTYFEKLFKHNITLIAQSESDLGERMFDAFKFATKDDLDSIVMIGTDSPTFPVNFLEDAFELLEQNDSVLGKTEDGGFYLIGLKRLDIRIFQNLEWSSRTTFDQTKDNLEKLDFKIGQLPVWYDVDVPADIDKLLKDKYLEKFAPHTAKWLKSLSQ